MSNLPFKTDKFKLLQAKWYKKLEQGGFEDAETPLGSLKEYTSSLKHDPIKSQAKEEYYRLAGQFLYDHSFSSRTEAYIWELHSIGISIRAIVKKLRKDKGVRTYKQHVHEIIQKLAAEMICKRTGTSK